VCTCCVCLAAATTAPAPVVTTMPAEAGSKAYSSRVFLNENHHRAVADPEGGGAVLCGIKQINDLRIAKFL
jgi:hypothetical protein